MKMKKRLSLIIVLVMALTMIPAAAVYAEEKTPEEPVLTESVSEDSPAQPQFTDVKPGDWYYDSVIYVYDHKIMTGMTETYFGAAENLARAQFAAILYRMAGEPAVEEKQIFPDVPATEETKWYADAVVWAKENRIITGYENGTFGPADDITREQIAVILYRYATDCGVDTGTKADISKYPDAKEVSDWAVEAMQWAVGRGILKGQDGNVLDPQGHADRAECAAMVQRFKVLPMTYETFKSLSPEQQIEVFDKMTGPEIYALVESSDENWPVTSYDLISPENAKETIVLYNNNGDLHFNLAWPCYGGFLPESIASIGELTGKLDVSRDGGNGGCSMSYGRNEDGSYPNDSQRSVPKTSATVRTGILDIDRYNSVVDVVVSGESKESRISALTEMGYPQEIAERFLSDQASWLTRDEVSGPNNIADGAKMAGHTVESKYGYYGVTAPWVVADLNLEGGGNQLETVFSWGTLCDSGLISDIGTAEIH